jgi:hypothetical protein
MTLSLFFVILGTLIYIAGIVPYIYHTLHGRVVPHPFSYTIWAILVGINTFVLFSSGVVDITLMTPIVRTFALISCAVLGWIYIRKISIDRYDYLCLMLAILCLIIVYFYGLTHAIIPTIIVDLFVLAPSIKKIWLNPDSEEIFAWVCAAISQICMLLSFSTYTFDTTIFWIYDTIINISVAILIYRRRVQASKWLYRIKKLSYRLLFWKNKLE